MLLPALGRWASACRVLEPGQRWRIEFLSKSPSTLRRDAARFRPIRRLQNGDVIATRQVAPCRRVVRDVNGVVLFVEHLAACDSGIMVYDVAGKGLYDRETLVSFKSAFYEV